MPSISWSHTFVKLEPVEEPDAECEHKWSNGGDKKDIVGAQ